MKALDLFCGAGGSSMGLKQAGFEEILGVDINMQPKYPFEFIQSDIFNLDIKFMKQFDFIWASPPCQAYSIACRHHKKRGKKYPDLISKTRDLLLKPKKPFVIENVCEAPIRKDLILCGQMFGLKVIRNRAFEINGFKVAPPALFKEIKSGLVKNGHYVTVAGHGGNDSGHNYCKLRGLERKTKLEIWQKAMGIDWITDKKMLAEAVPPAYAKYIGEAFIRSKFRKGEGWQIE